jgi:hypothetical protein
MIVMNLTLVGTTHIYCQCKATMYIHVHTYTVSGFFYLLVNKNLGTQANKCSN